MIHFSKTEMSFQEQLLKKFKELVEKKNNYYIAFKKRGVQLLLERGREHDGRNPSKVEILRKYVRTTTNMINICLPLFETYQKKKKLRMKGLVSKLIKQIEFNSKFQTDILDIQLQSNKQLKFILNYQDHLTKFIPFFLLIN